MAYFNTIAMSDDLLLDLIKTLWRGTVSTGNPPTNVEYYNGYHPTDNYQIRLITHDVGGSTFFTYKVGCRMTEGVNGHTCFVKIPCNSLDMGLTPRATIDYYLMLNNGVNISVSNGVPFGSTDTAKRFFNNWYNWNFPSNQGEMFLAYNDTVYNKINTVLSFGSSIKAKLGTIKDSVPSLRCNQVEENGIVFNSSYMPCMSKACAYTWDSLPFPVFDINNTSAIIKYLTDGDDSGSIDPFDPNTPQKIRVEDIRTNYKIFVSADEEDKNKTHFSVVAYNDDYIQLGDTVTGLYGMNVIVDEIESVLHPITLDMGYAKQSKFPTMGLLVNIPNVYNIKPRFEALDGSMMDTRITVGFNKAPNKESNCKVVDVYEGSQIMTKSNIPDGYRFSHTTDGFTRTVDVLFRHITIEDLKDYYPDHEDAENDSTGTDTTFAGASGLHTYAITDNDFKVINSKLWTTDWTQVFKSTTIDPVKCVIACKSIPFTANVVNSADVFIANMNTGLHKNYVKTVKSFNVGTGVYIPAFNGDFTDITMTRIHCYLPYIGWVELPASECVSRNAYRNVPANIKRVSFKYLVDFVDGTCRCIVSVNGTERWFFDGNCSIDVPVTSDNHTQAISNALRSGLQTGLSIVSGVVGAVSGNAGAVAGGIVGAMTSAPNIFPTYNYTATSNGSGYINASMNTNIILVVERPNVVRPIDYSQRVGRPCGLSLQLGSLRGFTKCNNVDVSGITATDNELNMIKSLLETGVYL